MYTFNNFAHVDLDNVKCQKLNKLYVTIEKKVVYLIPITTKLSRPSSYVSISRKRFLLASAGNDCSLPKNPITFVYSFLP